MKGGPEPSPEEIRAKFYEHYRKEAEEYDKDFMKKYDEDLNTTLIFVCHPRCPGALVLICVTGWSILRRRLRLHHRGQF